MEKLGDKVRRLRVQCGLTQESLGDELGVSRQTVGGWESGELKPNAEHVVKICDYFNISADFLLYGSPNPTAEQLLKESEKPDTECAADADFAPVEKKRLTKGAVAAIVISCVVVAVIVISVIISKLLNSSKVAYSLTISTKRLSRLIALLVGIFLAVAGIITVVTVALVGKKKKKAQQCRKMQKNTEKGRITKKNSEKSAKEKKNEE